MTACGFSVDSLSTVWSLQPRFHDPLASLITTALLDNNIRHLAARLLTGFPGAFFAGFACSARCLGGIVLVINNDAAAYITTTLN
jgi:hypothetical protein